MANKPKTGNESALMKPRKGETGYIPWRIEVLPDLKSEYVERAEKENRTLKSLVIEALESYISQ